MRMSHNVHKPPRFKANKRGGNRSFHYTLLLKKILYPLFGRKVRPYQLVRPWTRRRRIKASVAGRYRLLLNRVETTPSILATKLGWAPTIEWSRHFDRNFWYSVSVDHNRHAPHFPPADRDISQDAKFPLKSSELRKYKLESNHQSQNYEERTWVNHAKVYELRRWDIMQINPQILNVIKAYLWTKPKWHYPVFRNYMDANMGRTSMLVLKAPNVWHLRKRDRNNANVMRTLFN